MLNKISIQNSNDFSKYLGVSSKPGLEYQRISIDRSKLSEDEAFEHAIDMISTRQMGFRKAADFFQVGFLFFTFCLIFQKALLIFLINSVFLPLAFWYRAPIGGFASKLRWTIGWEVSEILLDIQIYRQTLCYFIEWDRRNCMIQTSSNFFIFI